jgi:D-alanyl-D-alanine carboxypeptidase/D-alanyl-D-alanine-endopeptidase (penicillin-binding protein 4)
MPTSSRSSFVSSGSMRAASPRWGRRVFLFGAALAVAALLVSFSGGGQVSAGEPSLAERIGAEINGAKFGEKGKFAACVVDLDTGALVYSRNAAEPMIPASNMKLLTTAAALCELGDDYQLRTELRYRGTVDDGVLDGDLLLRGYGDPNISGREHDGDITFMLKKLASGVKDMGVKKVTGHLYYDGSYFRGPSVHSEWPEDQYLKWYSAEISALTLNDNCVTITVTPQADGKGPASVRLDPPSNIFTLSGSVDSNPGKKDPKVGWSRPKDSNDIKLWGDVAAGRGGFTGDLTVHDPDAFCGRVMLDTLSAAGISVAGGVEQATAGKTPSSGWKLGAKVTSDLPSTIFTCNSNSQNFYAESILRVLGAEKSGEGSFAGGAKAVEAFLASKGLPRDGVVVADGSGLARTNRVTAQLLARLLRYMSTRKEGALYLGSLAVSGESGTLTRRLAGAATKGRVFAKTGTIRGVSTLSGYVVSKSGKRYAFSLLSNNTGAGRGVIDSVVTEIAK